MIEEMSRNARSYYLTYASPEKMVEGAMAAINYVASMCK
jgi:hypothetical protein